MITLTGSPAQVIANPVLEIVGGQQLSGELRVSGAKNSALVLMTACLLSRDTIRLRNVPELTDIAAMAEVLTSLGGRIVQHADGLELNGDGINNSTAPYELVNSLRASFFVSVRCWPAPAWPRCPCPAAAKSAAGPWWNTCVASRPWGPR